MQRAENNDTVGEIVDTVASMREHDRQKVKYFAFGVSAAAEPAPPEEEAQADETK